MTSTYLEHIKVEPFELGCKVILPQLDIDNDFLILYVIRAGNGLEITDMGRAHDLLRARGVEVNTPKRLAVAQNLAEINGARWRGDEVVIQIPAEETGDMGEKVLLEANAVSSIMAMIQMREPYGVLDFRGEVRQFLKTKDVEHRFRYFMEVPTIGRMSVDFFLPRRKTGVVLDALHATTPKTAGDAVDRTFMRFYHIGMMPTPPARAVIYNDDSRIPEINRFAALLEVTDVSPVPWTEREEGLRQILEATPE